MHPGMYGVYFEGRDNPAPTGTGVGVGALTSEQAFQSHGVQTLQPEADILVKHHLANLFLTGQIPEPLLGVAHFNAVPRPVAEQNNGDTTRSATDVLKDRPCGSVVLVNPLSASGTFVDIYVTTTEEAAVNLAGPGTDFAIVGISSTACPQEPAPKTEKKSKTTNILVGAAAGGAIGFVTAGPPGALVGAGIGAAGGAIV